MACKAIQHLESLGFLINKEKSVLSPQYSQEFLGFNFNMQIMNISVPMKKISKLILKIKQAIKPAVRSCRWFAGIMGKMISMIPAISEALLHIRCLQRDLARTFWLNYQNRDSIFQLSPTGKQELEWWLTWIQDKNGLPIRKTVMSCFVKLERRERKNWTGTNKLGWTTKRGQERVTLRAWSCELQIGLTIIDK